MTKRISLAAMLLIITAGLVVAGAQQEAPKAEGQPYAGVTIKYMAVAEPISDHIRNDIIPGFTAKTGIKVEMDTTDYVKLHDKQVLELIAGRYDVYQVDQMWVTKYTRNGWLEPLNDYIKKFNTPVANYYPNLVDVGTVDGKIYAFPLSAIPVDLFYNKNMFAEAGLSTSLETWDDVLSAAETLTKDKNGDGVIDQWGTAIRGERGNPITWTYLPMLWSYGAKIFDDQMKPVYNSPEAVAAVSYFKELNQYSPPGWHSAQDIAALMQQGQAGILTLMSVYNGAMDDPAQSKVVGDIEFADMPKGPTGNRASILGLWTIGVAAKSTKKEAAALFLDYLTQFEVGKKMAFSGTVSATMSKIYQEPDAPRFYPVLGSVLNYVQAPPLIPEAEEWFLSIGTALQEALAGEKTPQQAMDDSVEQVYNILKDAGYY
jgi:ABC-type glycerol-3-phosphate transport system substrate-binding protein